MYVDPPVMKRNKIRCPHCGKFQPLSEYHQSDVQGFFRNPETGSLCLAEELRTCAEVKDDESR